MFFLFLFAAHLQAVIIPFILGIQSIYKFKNFKNNFLISFGFISFGLASLFEMIDHTNTEWTYIDHSSIFNWLFYSFLALGLTSLSISFVNRRIIKVLNLFLSFCSIFSYLLISKTAALPFQIMLSIFLIINWQKFFKDWILIFYPIFGIILTTFFGTNLSISNNQTWHIFIGPSGTLSVLTFYFILIRYEKRNT